MSSRAKVEVSGEKKLKVQTGAVKRMLKVSKNSRMILPITKIKSLSDNRRLQRTKRKSSITRHVFKR